MRERKRVTVDLRTGEITEDVVNLPDATFGQRFAELKASLPGLGPDDVLVATVRCNKCDTTAIIDWDRPRLPDGWATSEAGELCGACNPARF